MDECGIHSLINVLLVGHFPTKMALYARVSNIHSLNGQSGIAPSSLRVPRDISLPGFNIRIPEKSILPNKAISTQMGPRKAEV